MKMSISYVLKPINTLLDIYTRIGLTITGVLAWNMSSEAHKEKQSKPLDQSRRVHLSNIQVKSHMLRYPNLWDPQYRQISEAHWLDSLA